MRVMPALPLWPLANLPLPVFRPSDSIVENPMSANTPRDALHEVATAALKAGFGEFAKESIKAHFGAVVAEVAGEVAKGGVEHFAGPLLRVLLHVTSENSAGLDKLLSEPARTGLREARRALDLAPVSDTDLRIRHERLQSADEKLAEAISLEEPKRSPGKVAYFYFIRGLIARERGATAVARMEFDAVEEILRPLTGEFPWLEARYRADYLAGPSSGHPGMIIGHAGGLEQLRAKIEFLRPMQVLLDTAAQMRP